MCSSIFKRFKKLWKKHTQKMSTFIYEKPLSKLALHGIQTVEVITPDMILNSAFSSRLESKSTVTTSILNQEILAYKY